MIDIAPLIGREPECATLTRAVADVRQGHGCTVVIAGEAGIGKSRLVAETAAHAVAQGFSVLSGACFTSDRAVPYAPVLDLLRHALLGRAPEEVAHLLGPGGLGLITLLPELAHTLPAVPERADEPEHEKRRLIHAFVAFVHARAAQQPVLVAVEDLHWCDGTSLELLLTLARRSADRPVLLLVTHRGDEVHPDLALLLQEMTRARLAHTLNLRPLTRDHAGTLLQALYRQPAPPRTDVVEALHALTDGNPFFLEEVAKSIPAPEGLFAPGATGLSPTGLVAPQSIQEAVRRRVDRLSEAARNTLLWAAVTGRRFDFDLLQDLTGSGERDLLAAIRELIAAFLVVEEAEDRFAFRHALTRQAVLAGLLARERRAFHAAVAAAIERRQDGEARAADLALHFHEAGNAERTLHYARIAGDAALAMYTPRAAVEQFTRALDAAATLKQTVAHLFHARAKAFDALGEFERARQDYEAAIAASAIGDTRAEWQSVIDLGFLWAGRDYRRAGEHLARALDLARTMHDPRAVAYSLNRFGNWRVNVQQPEEAIRLHQEALALIETIDDAAGVAETLDLLGMAHYQHGEMIQAAGLFHQAARHFAALDHRHGLSSSLAMLALCGPSCVNMTEVWATISPTQRLQNAKQAFATAEAAMWRPGESFAQMNAGVVHLSQGRFADALAVTADALAIAEAIEHRQWLLAAHGVLGRICFEMFEQDAALHHLRLSWELALESGSGVWIQNIAGWLGQAYLRAGDTAAAGQVLTIALDAVSATRTLASRLAALVRAELALVLQRPEEALHRIDDLLATTRNAAPHRPVPHLLLDRAGALLQLGRPVEACVALDQARATAEAFGCRPLLIRIFATLARAQIAAGRQQDAATSLDAARVLVEQLAPEIPAERTTTAGTPLREQFVAAALATFPPLRRPTQLQAAKSAAGGLTQREREVAALVAHGLTNREIAGRLILGERTVETHVTNILAKLAFASRAQIAAWAAEHRLDATAP